MARAREDPISPMPISAIRSNRGVSVMPARMVSADPPGSAHELGERGHDSAHILLRADRDAERIRQPVTPDAARDDPAPVQACERRLGTAMPRHVHDHELAHAGRPHKTEIASTSCRARVCTYV